MTEKMKKILGFDGWTEGACYFERLVPAFKKLGFDLILIHIGSWGHDIGRPKEEMIGKLCVRDISYYGVKGVNEILDAEKPCAILFMSTRSIAHMAFNRYARFRNIPTCHMYHGLVMVQAFGKGETAYNINYIKHVNLFFNRIIKNIFIILPFYIKSLLATDCSLGEFFSFMRLIIYRGIGFVNNSNPYITDTKTDIGCVYAESDIEHMHLNYGIPLDKIYTIGNPDIIRFGVTAADIGSALEEPINSKSIIYIDTALTEVGAVFNSSADFIRHLSDTMRRLDSLGYDFWVKLHPAHYRSDIPDILIKNGVKICGDTDFIIKLKNVAAVITEPSTAAIIPALIGVPILLAQYGRLERQSYGHVLSSYPRARFLTALIDLPRVLSEENASLKRDEVFRWIEVNGGPMPAEEMPDRAALAVRSLVSIND